MPVCNGIELTEALNDAIKAAVNAAGDTSLLSYLASHPDLKRGVRLMRANYPIFRRKIAAHLKSVRELDSDAIELLYDGGLGQAFVVVLSEEALKLHADEFHAWFGAEFVLALLLDPRPEVQQIGCELQDRPQPEMAPETAREAICENMERFADLFLKICEPEARLDAVDNEMLERVQECERKLREEESRNRELGARLRDQQEQHTDELTDKNIRISSLKNKLEQTCSKLVIASNDLALYQQELEAERTGRQALVDQALRQELSRVTSRWLGERERIDRYMQDEPGNDDIFATADRVLEKQAHADRHCGNRKQLQERLTSVSAKLADVRDARANAIHPVEGLGQIESQLLAVERSITSLLESAGSQQSVSPIAQALAGRINTAPESALHHLEEIYAELCTMGLSRSDTLFLKKALCDRYDRLIAEPGNRRIPLNPALRFRMALAGDRPVTLICDGHNLLNCMEQFREAIGNGHAMARISLINSIMSLLNGYANCQGYIVFDGPIPNREQASDNLTVIYSGGGANEAHRADRRIAEMLTWQEYAGNGEQVFVVSADNDVTKDARDKGMEIITLEQFGWLMR